MQPPERVVGEQARARARQPVLRRIAVGGAAGRGEVAARVVGRRHRARGGILVEPVRRIGAADVVVPGPSIRLAPTGRGRRSG